MRKNEHSLKHALVISTLVVLIPCALVAQSKVGTTAAQFLGISVGPRAIAMGGAYVASASDVTSLYWNPGAFVQASRSEFNFSNTQWLVGTKFRWLGFMYNFDGDNAIGASLTQLDYGTEPVTTVAAPEGTGDNWSANDFAFALSYARRLTDRFSIGGSAKFITQTIWHETASTFAFDVGLLFVTGFNDMRLGVSLTNFGGDMKMEGQDLMNQIDIDPQNSGSNKNNVASLKTESWPIPLAFRVGLAMDVVKNDMFTVTVATDGVLPNDNQASVNLGGEIGWNNMVFLRGGYKSAFRASSKVFDREDQQEGLGLGAGVRYTAPGIATVAVDYAYDQFGLFGNLNTIALSISF